MSNKRTKPSFDDFNLTLHWVSVAELTANAELSCIDGRHNGCVLGAPGGDAGEFILMLGGLEKVCDARFDAERVEAILSHYMDRYGRFYLHTDRHALDALTETVGEHDALREALDAAESIDALLLEPPEGVREVLADLLVDPKHVGCGHLKTMLSHIDEYDVRKELVEDTIRAFHHMLWRGRPEADLTILEGDHQESAIINFETPDELEADAEVPAVCSSPDGPHIFANHEAARRYKRMRDLEMLADMPGVVPEDPETRKELLAEINTLAKKQAAATVSYLAPDLPNYAVTFKGSDIDTEMM
ncbi:hypothetical protein FIV42_07675 [Persicimonas caeni]|uniref:Uncharacterized protein n=1 Tax=Persicimonas caeni TaxID=2292766 RepID=A0A4Y6PQL4_PERCE|nr:hypothetical protein [Persicimonas caeni]QDG50614.1 hypothetical protein FIV42_07675 [Persicimonas caeni]QED31835.1 hypothetical protein FRD00_07670 [Persicimonas caeni]